VARRNGYRQPVHFRRTSHVRRMANLDMLGRVPRNLRCVNVGDVRHGEMAGEGYCVTR
jgi:hypothetical protein